MSQDRVERKVVCGLPWIRENDEEEESWRLDIPGLYVWVKDYGEMDLLPREGKSIFDDPWWGWRVGRGGSPEGGKNPMWRFDNAEAAMVAGLKVALDQANEKIADAHSELERATETKFELMRCWGQ